MTLEDLYLKCPIFIQNLFINLQGFKLKYRRYNANFKFYLENYLSSNPGKIDQVQLKLFCEKAQKTSFWKERFEKYSVNLKENNLISELKKLPILTKNEVKENISSIINPNIKENFINTHTSGTTGSGLVFPQTLSMENKQWAIWWRYRTWHGVTLDLWMGWFGGRSIASISQNQPPFWRINYPMKQIMFSAQHLNERTVRYYFNEIKKKKLKWLHGYPSQLSLLAHLIKDQNLGGLPDVTIITLGAENLLESQKSIINEVFNSQIRQHYGLAEGVANISEQSNGNLIPDQDFCWVEFIPINSHNPNLCKIVGTNYNNDAFPLIRYDTGDYAEIEWNPDGSFKILSIDGRKEDYITLPNGVKLGRLDHIFKDLINISEAQIKQDKDGNISFLIVKNRQYNEMDEDQLKREINKRLDFNSYAINYVDKIERTKSGKLRLVLSENK